MEAASSSGNMKKKQKKTQVIYSTKNTTKEKDKEAYDPRTPYVLNLEVIKNNLNFPTCVRVLAGHLQAYPFFTAGKFFEYISTEQLLQLQKIFSSLNTKVDAGTQLFVLESKEQEDDLYTASILAFLLAFGEGEAVLDATKLLPALQNLQAIIDFEVLASKGRAIVHRQNYSVLDDQKVIGYIKKDKD